MATGSVPSSVRRMRAIVPLGVGLDAGVGGHHRYGPVRLQEAEEGAELLVSP
ncbi:hypothetical protein [Actinomadura napierensis]|uniref:hypothetical protein n=1 Tax=Actinomadura napierensis TaxID=267854 RepID=UPI0031DDBE26